MEDPGKLPIEINAETSKVPHLIWPVAIIVLSLAVIVGGLTLRPARKPSAVPQVTPDNTTTMSATTPDNTRRNLYPGYAAVDDQCDEKQCLFENKDSDNPLLGLAALQGYYLKSTRLNLTEEEVACDTFVVTNGSQPLINHLIELVDKGNTVNTLNEIRQPIINLDLKNLSSVDQRIIEQSTKNKEVSLSVIRHMSQGSGAPPCASFVDVLKAAPINN